MYQYINAAFNKDFTQHCSLLLQLEEHQVSFVIYEKRTGKLLVLKVIGISGSDNYTAKLKHAIMNEDMLNLLVAETKINISWPAFTLIPI